MHDFLLISALNEIKIIEDAMKNVFEYFFKYFKLMFLIFGYEMIFKMPKIAKIGLESLIIMKLRPSELLVICYKHAKSNCVFGFRRLSSPQK